MNAAQKSQKYSKQTHYQAQTGNSIHYTTENNIYHQKSKITWKTSKKTKTNYLITWKEQRKIIRKQNSYEKNKEKMLL